MKISVVARGLLVALACLAGVSAHAQTAPFGKPKYVVPAFDGTLLGFDRGEWGGALVFVDKDGRETRVFDGNVKGIARLGQRVVVFSGLAHMGINRGSILALALDANGAPVARELADLKAEPSAVRQVDEDSVVFRLFTGKLVDNAWVYQCKSLAGDTVSDSDACASGAGQ